MAKIKRDPKRTEAIKKFLELYQPESVDDIYESLKDMLGETIEQMLEAELDEQIGYSKGSKPQGVLNARNGYSSKTLKSKTGELDINIPRDRNGEFEPQIVKKYQTDISHIEEQIISMYGKGMTVADISKHIEDIYGFSVSNGLISQITNKILPTIAEWQNRGLEAVYPIIFLDAIHYNVRQDGIVTKKAVYIIIGINMEGKKDVLGMWVGENESSKFWLTVITELKNRGVRDILIAYIDGLSGFSEAIHAVFPRTEIQRCIIHQIRSSTKYVSYKDVKELMRDLKDIYKAPSEEQALRNLDEFEDKWVKKYPSCVKSWRSNWAELSAYFKYPEEVRTIIYTTNAMENFNRQLRKVTKSKSVFPSDAALMKTLYLAMFDTTAKWTSRIRNWDYILNHFAIYFEGRVAL